MGSTAHPHIALIAFPFGTHAAPLFSLTQALASAAPDATFSFINTARSNAALSQSIAPAIHANGKIRVYNVTDGSPEGYVPPAGDTQDEVRRFLAVTPENIKVAMEAAVEGAGGVRVTCIVSDAFLWFMGKICEEVKVPWVPLWTGGPFSLAAHMYTNELRLKIGVSGEQAHSKENLDIIPYMSAIQVRELPEGIVFGDINSVFSQLLHRMGEELPNAAIVVINTFHGLDPALDTEFKTLFKQSLPVGPLNLLTPPPPVPDSHGCIPWLDTQAPASVVYISFGTLMSPPPTEVAALAQGLEASGAPFLWSLKVAARAHLPLGFLERTIGRGLVVSWAPQLEVLRHVATGVFLTHCGWNSVLESVTSGVPMMCRPFLGDQRMNTGVVSRVWKIGVGFEGGVVTASAMERALSLMLKDEEGGRMRKRAGEIKEMALEAVRAEGSSTINFNSLVDVICRC